MNAYLNSTAPSRGVLRGPDLTLDLAKWNIPRLLKAGLLWEEDWDLVPETVRADIEASVDSHTLLYHLSERGLISRYAADRILAGTTFGLVIGNYRMIDRLGAGGMGIVFKAEHRLMRRPVAVKVLPVRMEDDSRYARRFRQETRIIAQLRHPNVVSALDAGILTNPDDDGPDLHYLVMEFIEGADLEQYVMQHGVLSIELVCNLGYQLASALDEANRHGLVHRDIKPSNIFLTTDGQAKLLDFGLARPKELNNLTEVGSTLGTLDFMAPEQIDDAHSVDIRADMFSLGATMYWLLTGKNPFPSSGNLWQDLLKRQTEPAPSVRKRREDIPPSLDAVIGRLLSTRPDDRYPTPQTLMNALLGFLSVGMSDRTAMSMPTSSSTVQIGHAKLGRVLIIDDDKGIGQFCAAALTPEGFECESVVTGQAGLERVKQQHYDLILLDSELPDTRGEQLLPLLRAERSGTMQKIIMMSGSLPSDDLATRLLEGADDYLAKPLSIRTLTARVKTALRLKEAQEQSVMLNQQLLGINAQLEAKLHTSDDENGRLRQAMVLTLGELVRQRASHETASHLTRLPKYSICLAECARNHPAFAGQIDDEFLEELEFATPLHDIGLLVLPDHVLMKPGRLSAEEIIIMQTHTVIGAEVLTRMATWYGLGDRFLQSAINVVRSHHERFNGTGYPDRLSGAQIPLAARILAIADVYDSLRSRRPFRPALSHATALQVILGPTSEGSFDPELIALFRNCSDRFDIIFRETPD